MERGYPKREHLKKPRNAFDVIDGELRLYPDGASFREALIGLNKMYRGTDYGQSLQKHAIKASSAHALLERTRLEDNRRITTDESSRMLYAGGVLGLYAQTAPLSPPIKRFIVELSFDIAVEPVDGEEETSYSARSAAQYMNYSDFIGKEFQQLSDRQQFVLMTAAERACEGYGPSYEGIFIEGAMTTISGIRSALNYLKKNPA